MYSGYLEKYEKQSDEYSLEESDNSSSISKDDENEKDVNKALIAEMSREITSCFTNTFREFREENRNEIRKRKEESKGVQKRKKKEDEIRGWPNFVSKLYTKNKNGRFEKVKTVDTYIRGPHKEENWMSKELCKELRLKPEKPRKAISRCFYHSNGKKEWLKVYGTVQLYVQMKHHQKKVKLKFLVLKTEWLRICQKDLGKLY